MDPLAYILFLIALDILIWMIGIWISSRKKDSYANHDDLPIEKLQEVLLGKLTTTFSGAYSNKECIFHSFNLLRFMISLVLIWINMIEFYMTEPSFIGVVSFLWEESLSNLLISRYINALMFTTMLHLDTGVSDDSIYKRVLKYLSIIALVAGLVPFILCLCVSFPVIITSIWPAAYLILVAVVYIFAINHYGNWIFDGVFNEWSEENKNIATYLGGIMQAYNLLMIFSIPGLCTYGWLYPKMPYEEAMQFTTQLRPGLLGWSITKITQLRGLL